MDRGNDTTLFLQLQVAPSSALRLRLPYSARFYKIKGLLPATPRRKLGPPE